MARNPSQELSKRERQIMDIIYMLGEATAAEILEYLPEEVGDASARKLIRIVEQKGYLTHRREGHSYVYRPITPKKVAGKQALRHLLQTFFHGSAPKAVSTLLEVAGNQMSAEEIGEIEKLIKKAEKKGQ